MSLSFKALLDPRCIPRRQLVQALPSTRHSITSVCRPALFHSVEGASSGGVCCTGVNHGSPPPFPPRKLKSVKRITQSFVLRRWLLRSSALESDTLRRRLWAR